MKHTDRFTTKRITQLIDLLGGHTEATIGRHVPAMLRITKDNAVSSDLGVGFPLRIAQVMDEVTGKFIVEFEFFVVDNRRNGSNPPTLTAYPCRFIDRIHERTEEGLKLTSGVLDEYTPSVQGKLVRRAREWFQQWVILHILK